MLWKIASRILFFPQKMFYFSGGYSLNIYEKKKDNYSLAQYSIGAFKVSLHSKFLLGKFIRQHKKDERDNGL